MADFGGLKLNFSTVDGGCAQILSYVESLKGELQYIKTTFQSMTESWDGMARIRFDEDFRIMDNSMDTTVQTMEEITRMIQRYNADVQAVESGYGSNEHVTSL